MRKIHKAWLIGPETSIGRAILNKIDERMINIIATDMDDVNILDIDEALAFSYLNQPDAIINCYDLCDIEECENDPIKAYKVNSFLPRNLAICSRKIGSRFIQLSSNFVFGEERKVPYNEFDVPNPDNVYGKSKLQGENFVRELSQKYFIIRTDYVYRDKKEIFDTPYKGDRLICPTSSMELAKFIIKLMNTPEYGIYHAGSTDYCTYDIFMKKAIDLSGEKHDEILNAKVKNSYKDIRLNQFVLKLTNLYKFTDWKTQLENCLKN